MSIIEAIKNGFVKTSKLLNVVGVFFVFNVVVGLISLPLTNPERAGNPGVVAVSIISSVLFFLIFIFLQGGALGLVRDQIKTATASMSKFVDYGKKFYLRILGILVLYVLIAIAVVLILSLITSGILLLGDNVVTRTIVAVLVTVVAVGIITLLIYPIYSIVVDDISTIAALKKGVNVAKSNFWVTLGLFIAMLIVSLVISLVVGFLIGLVTVPLPLAASQVIITIINALVQSYIPIVMMVAFMSFYMALCMGKSGPAEASTEPMV